MNMPEPKLFTSLPDESNLRMDGSVLPAQLFAPHRSATQMLLPSRSISTALVEPQGLPSGSFAQFSTVRYGLGCELGSSLLCPRADMANTMTSVSLSMCTSLIYRDRDVDSG